MPMSDFLTFIEPCHNTGSFSSTGSSTPQSTSNVPLKFFVHRSIFATITPCGNVNVLTMGNNPFKEVPSTLFQSTCTCVKSNKQQKIRRRGGGKKSGLIVQRCNKQFKQHILVSVRAPTCFCSPKVLAKTATQHTQ